MLDNSEVSRTGAINGTEFRRCVRAAAVIVIVVVLACLLLAWRLRTIGLAAPLPAGGIFYRLFALYEWPMLLLVGAFALVARFVSAKNADLPPPTMLAVTPKFIGVAAVVLALLMRLGADWTGLSYDLAMDEFNIGFQAAIFAKGKLMATVAEKWRPTVDALRPIFVMWIPERGAWVSTYLPLASITRLSFEWIGLAHWVNPAAIALTLMLLPRARSSGPSIERDYGRAALFLFASSQVLITGMTGYSMPLHALASVAWLRCYLADTRRLDVCAALIGGLALGIHNPFPHALFVAPFLLRLLLLRRLDRLTIFAFVYGVACAVWWGWLRMVRSVASGSTAIESFSVPALDSLPVHLLNLGLTFTWQSPLVGLLLVVALLRWSHLSQLHRDLLAGLILTATFYLFFPRDQGHGWGYRYIFACLPSVSLLCADIWRRWSEACGRSVDRLLYASLAIGLVIQMPFRVAEARTLAHPFARAHQRLSAVDADVVIIPTTTHWYAVDLVRNDPWLKTKPLVMARERLDTNDIAKLRATFGSRVVEWPDAELTSAGLERVSLRPTH